MLVPQYRAGFCRGLQLFGMSNWKNPKKFFRGFFIANYFVSFLLVPFFLAHVIVSVPYSEEISLLEICLVGL